MRANPADYTLVSPGSLSAVLALLAEQPGHYTPIAGGTELMVQYAAGCLAARHLVDIRNLPELTTITATEQEITVGACVTYTALRNHPELSTAFPLLARAATWTGAIANQNRGTLGGNLVNASPAADSPPALLAYAAELSLTSVRGTRRIPYDSFHTAFKQTALAPDELVLAIHLPLAAYTHQYLRKVGARQAMAISKVALGAVATLTDGLITEVRLGLASVSHAPLRCRNTEATLLNRPPTPPVIAAARQTLLAEIAPLDDIRSTASYRQQVSANLLQEFLQQLASPGSGMQLSEQQLLQFCGSRRWAREVAAKGRFAHNEELLSVAGSVWFSLTEPDWLEAFAAHPRIGESKPPATEYLVHSEQEQSAAQHSLAPVADRLAELNHLYEQRFGFRYIVFASGRNAPELLAILEARLTHTRAEELEEAARQQHLITERRIMKWLHP